MLLFLLIAALVPVYSLGSNYEPDQLSSDESRAEVDAYPTAIDLSARSDSVAEPGDTVDTCTATIDLSDRSDSVAGPGYTATIDLSARSDSVAGPGYTVIGGPGYAYDPRFYEKDPKAVVRFNPAANGNSYHIVQNGIPNNPDAKGRKYGSSMVRSIIIPSEVSITLVVSDIHLIGSIYLEGTAHVTLLLDEESVVWGSIEVPRDSALTIESLNGSHTADRLVMPSEANSSSNNARIGGPGGTGSTVGNNAGTITINGGGIDIVARSTGAGIGGGSRGPLGTGVAGTGGNITINGGIVSVAQYGSGNDWGTGSSGAGIGGGGGFSYASEGAGAGNVLINGGTVIVRQYTRAAGIGGGTFGPAGNVTITGGDVDVEVIRRIDQSGAGDGSAIGNAAGTNPGYGNITISGGTVRAVANMTAIGKVQGNEVGTNQLNITISGGTVYAKGNHGPGIGYWTGSNGSSITITGGSIVSESDKSAGIGGNLDTPLFCLDAAAEVKAYAGGTLPAFNVADNSGNGYYVNASLIAVVSATSATTLNVYNSGVMLKSLSLPANYRHFGYSSDISTARTDNIIAQNDSAIVGVVVRVVDDSMDIYSVITRSGYLAHNGTDGSLPVKFLGSGGMTYTITEKHVDLLGNPIPGVADSETRVALGGYYHKPLPVIEGYEELGYIWDTPPAGDYTTGEPNLQIFGNKTIYYVYEVMIGTVNVLISKTIAGEHANTSRYFEFTVCLKDQDGNPLAEGTTFEYAGSTLLGSNSAPADGWLILDERGEAHFWLTHGQMITIYNVPANGQIQIIEGLDETNTYRPSFTDSKDGFSTADNDTGIRFLEAHEDRSFDFINTYMAAPPVGVDDIAFGLVFVLIICLLVLAGTVVYAMRVIRRRQGPREACLVGCLDRRIQ